MPLGHGDGLVFGAGVGEGDGGRAVLRALVGGGGESDALGTDADAADPVGPFLEGGREACSRHGIGDAVCDLARSGVVGQGDVVGVDHRRAGDDFLDVIGAAGQHFLGRVELLVDARDVIDMACLKAGAKIIDGGVHLDGRGAVGQVVFIIVNAAGQLVVVDQGAGVDAGEVGHVDVGRCDGAACGDRDARGCRVEEGEFGKTVVQLHLAVHGSAEDVAGIESHVASTAENDEALGPVGDEHVLPVGRDTGDDPVVQGDVHAGRGVANLCRLVEDGLHGVEGHHDGVGGLGDRAGIVAFMPSLGLDGGGLVDG